MVRENQVDLKWFLMRLLGKKEYVKRTTLVGDIGNGGGYARVGAGGIWKLSVLSIQ